MLLYYPDLVGFLLSANFLVQVNPVCGLHYIPFIFQASPVSVGGCQAYVEEKRSTNSRGKLGLCS